MHAGALFCQDKLPSCEVASRFAEEKGDLEWEDEFSIEILVEAVVIVLLILEKQWSWPSLTGLVAEIEEFVVS